MKDISQFLNEALVNENYGKDFEYIYARDFESKYREDLEKALKMKPGTLKGSTLDVIGGENNKRPLQKNGNYIFLGSKKGAATVGEDVVDVKLIEPDGDILYLSLKSTNTNTFCNVGISRLFPKSSFYDYLRFTTFVPGTNGNVDGMDLLNMFGIDPERFANVFTNYRKEISQKKAEKEYVDVTKHLQSNVFAKFIESVIGYNYVLIHEMNGKVYIYDLREKSDMESFIGDVTKAEVQYPQYGQAKRVNIYVEFTSGLKVMFNMRSKTENAFPTELMCDFLSH